MTGAVVFDLDNTLILEDESTFAALRAAAEVARARRALDADGLTRAAADTADRLWKASPEYEYSETFGIWWGEGLWGGFSGDGDAMRAMRAFVPGFRQAVWRGALGTLGIEDGALALDLQRAFVDARRSHETIDPDAPGVLADLGRDHRLALLTNGASDVQREKLSRTPFASLFDTIVISAEIGVGKPDPRIFETALARLGLTADAAVMVGDSLLRDVAGARRVGMRAVFVDRGLWHEGGPAPDARITRLSELRALLDAWARRPASPRVTT